MLFVLLPALGYIGTRSWLDRNQARAQARLTLLTLTQLAATGQQHALEELQRALALAASLAPVQAAAQGGDPAPCSTSLAQVATQYPETTGFGVWKLSGDLVCASQPVAYPGAVDQLWFRQAVAQRSFALGDFMIHDPPGQPTLVVGYPITSPNGQLLGVISTGLDLSHLIALPAAQPLPADGVVTVFDHQGVVLVSSLDAANWVGKALPEAPRLISALSTGASVTEQAGIDGVRRVCAFVPVTGPAGTLDYLSIGRPEQDVYGSADAALAVGLAITGALTVLALLLAGWWSRQTLIRPVQALLTTTERLAHGDLTARASQEPAGSEVDRLAAAFNTLAGRLEKGEADRNSAREDALQLQQSRARAAQLEAVSASLSMALSPGELLEVILRQGAGPVGASAATLLLLDEDGAWLKQAASVGYSDQITRLFRKFPVASPLPAADAVRTGEAVWIESATTFRARYPRLTDIIDATDYEAAAALPLRYAGRTVGVLSLSFSEVLAFTGDIQIYLVTLASLCAQALERARLQSERQPIGGDRETPSLPKIGDR